MSAEKSLTYILGLPFSGSSLFSVALGNSPDFVNLGEMNYLTYDWNNNRVCSCGETLKNCPFWGPLAREASKVTDQPILRLKDESSCHEIDYRYPGWRRRLALFFGKDLSEIYGKGSIEQYLSDHIAFMKLVFDETSAQEIVDASKNTRRFKLLAEQTDIPVRVIVISRSPAYAIGARIKRARRRNKYYWQVFSPYYTLWLILHSVQIRKAIRKIDENFVFQVSYEEFVSNPIAVQNELKNWYGKPIDFGISDPRELNLESAHVFTGNRWLTGDGGQSKRIEVKLSTKGPELKWFEYLQFRFFAVFFSSLR